MFNDPRNQDYERSKYPEKNLNTLINYSFSGKTPTSSVSDYWEGGSILWASPKDFSNDLFLNDTQDKITELAVEQSKLRFVEIGSVLMVVRSGVLLHTLPVMVCRERMTVNQDVKVFSFKKEILPAFVVEYLKVHEKRVLRLITKHSTTVQSVNTPELESLEIPLPPLPIQEKLVEEMERARESRRRKLAEADALLSTLDGWLLDTLGITPPVKNEKHKIFAMTLGKMKKRFDVAFSSPRFNKLREEIESNKYTVKSVGEVCESMKSGFAAGKQDQADNDIDGVPHLRPLNLSGLGDLTLNGTKYVPKSSITNEDLCQLGEVLFNNTNSEEWVGKSTVFELETDCASSNHMTRLKVNSETSPHYLASLFNALRSVGYLGMLATNFNNQAGINTQTLSALRLPFPDLLIQESIAEQINSRKTKARRLKSEAESEWQQAKDSFEGQLLGQ